MENTNSLPQVVVITPENVDLLAEKVATRIIPLITLKASTQRPQEDKDCALLTRAQACSILDRSDSCLRKWAQRGILVPVHRGSMTYFRREDVMKIYNEGI